MSDYVRIFMFCLIATPLLNPHASALCAWFNNSADLRQGAAQFLIGCAVFVLLAKGLAILASKHATNSKDVFREPPEPFSE